MASGEDRRNPGDRRGPDRREASKEPRTREANRRREARLRKRLPCEFVEGDKRLQGLVLDVSPKGMFVQTHKPIKPGGELSVTFTPPGLDRAIEVRGRVVRSLRVPRHLSSVASGGVGLKISSAPPEYFEYIASLTDRKSPVAKPKTHAVASVKPAKPKKRKLPPRMPKPEPKTRYRVQAKQAGGPRTRALVVSATSREQAESQVLAELGGDWKVVNVEGV